MSKLQMVMKGSHRMVEVMDLICYNENCIKLLKFIDAKNNIRG